MSLVVQSLLGSNTVSANGTTSTAASSGITTEVPFAQTLVQTMGGGTAQGTAAPLLGNLASLLQGLLNAVQPTGKVSEDEVSQNTDLLAGLKEDIEKLDDSISADPALLTALQGWLLQVSALLSGSNAEPAVMSTGTEDGVDTVGSLSPLAQNPATLRFAVQDDLNSLVTLIQQSAVSGDAEGAEAAAKGITLLNNFTALLAQAAPTESKTKVTASSVVANSGVAVVQPVEAENKVDTKVNALLTSSVSLKDILVGSKKETAANASAPSTANVEADSGVSNTPQVKVNVTVNVKKTDVTTAELTEIKVVSEDHEVVTAGQLSMRDGITTPLKTEAPPVSVPVHRFAQEMSEFITGKLEIVQKGGIAEATISLFPENLGQVDVKITMQNGHLVAQFLTQNSTTKDMLDQQMNQLRSALQSQGLQVEKLEVTQNNTALHSQFNQEGRQPGSGGQQSDSRSKKSRGDSDDAILAAELNSEWKEWTASAVQEGQNQGGNFSAKA